MGLNIKYEDGQVVITNERGATGPRGGHATVTSTSYVDCTLDEWRDAVRTMVVIVPPSTLTNEQKRALLIGLARQAVTLTETMDGTQLDDWYEANVGRRLLDEEPELSHVQHRAQVAEMMLRYGAPADASEGMVDEVASMLSLAIRRPPTPIDEYDERLLADARGRGWIL